ncbi:MAG: hypothetical protein IJ347_07075 [Faecalibacterium sp.]|nr:hypothetical protein [Faecalibacterium sp.]
MQRTFIDPGEAVRLANYAGFYISQANTARDIAIAVNEYDLQRGRVSSIDRQIHILQAVFNAGRVVGIRQERSKRRKEVHS